MEPQLMGPLVDETSEIVDGDLRSNEMGLPICGEIGGLANEMVCIIMRYGNRRHDSPHIFWPADEDLPIVTQIRRVAKPPWARGDDETGD